MKLFTLILFITLLIMKIDSNMSANTQLFHTNFQIGVLENDGFGKVDDLILYFVPVTRPVSTAEGTGICPL